MPSYPYMRNGRRRMLLAQTSSDLDWIRAAARAHVCHVESGPSRTAQACMVEALGHAFSASAGVVFEWLEAIERRVGVCSFCVLAYLFSADEPSPPLWFVRAYRANLPLGAEPPAQAEVALVHHLLWSALVTAGVRTQEDASCWMAAPRP